ncbi:MAG: protease inhibitor I42 family protein [Dehalococcoidales bacterium]|nr:protease inhibitor I42 family protein [Dehalococcoidales bacterium]
MGNPYKGELAIKLKLSVLFVIPFLLASLSSCAAVTPRAIIADIPCSQLQENNHITDNLAANIGDTITIMLCSYPATDYLWLHKTIGKPWETIVRETDHDFVTPEGDGVKLAKVIGGPDGSNEKQVWTFKVVGKGTTEIRMEYTLQQYGVFTVSNTYSMVVTVK